MKMIQKWIKKNQEKKISDRIEEIKNMFAIEEKKGSLYLTLGGFAFAKIEKYASAEEIAEKLNIARQNAIELEGVNDGC